MPELLPLLVRPMDEAGITYMLSGGLAAAIYGEPRFTKDVDLVVRIDAEVASALASLFPAPAFDCPSTRIMLAESQRPAGGRFSITHAASGHRADCHTIGDVPLYRWGLENRRRASIGSWSIWLASPEYVILAKLQADRMGGHPKHLEDIIAMLRIMQERVDRAVIDDWSTRLGCDAQWRAASTSASQ